MRFIVMPLADSLRGRGDTHLRCPSNANPASTNNHALACCDANAQTPTNFSDHAGINVNIHFNTRDTYTRSDGLESLARDPGEDRCKFAKGV